MRLNDIKWLGRNFVVFAVGFATVSYILSLLVLNYRSFIELRDQSLRKLHIETVRHAESLGYFFNERKDDLINLTLAREISVFFENKALGMSMEYGLGQSLIPISENFKSLIQRKKVENTPVYKRLVLIDQRGKLLIDTSSEREIHRNWKSFLAPEYRTGEIVTFKGHEGTVVSIAYYFKDRFAGQIIAFLNGEGVGQVLLGKKNTQRETYRLVLKEGVSQKLHVIYSCSSAGQDAAYSTEPDVLLSEYLLEGLVRPIQLPGSDRILITAPVPQTPFFLVRQAFDSPVIRNISPRNFLAGMILVSLVIILATYFTIRQNLKSKILKVRLEESMLREQEIREKEKALRESEERHKLALEGASLGTWDWEISSGRILVNNRWAEMLGYGLDEIKPEISTWENLIHPDDCMHVHAVVNEHLKGNTQNYETEHRLRHKSGRWIWVLDRGRVIARDPEGVPLRACGTHLDITDQMLMIEEIRRGQANLNSFFDLSVDFLFVLDLSGNILKVNRTVTDRLGYTEAQLIGQNVLVVHPPEVRDEAGRIVSDMLASRKECCPLPLLTSDGRYIPVETRIVRGFWDNKPALYGTSKDISDLAFSEEKFSKAFEFSSSLMAISSAEDGRFIDVNQSFLKTLGFSREEVVGRTSVELELFSRKQHEKIVADVKAFGEMSNQEITVSAKNGDCHTGLFSAKYIRIQSNTYLLTVMNDITEMKRMEQELEEARGNAVLASNAKSLFVANVSHEIRTPLNEILGLSHLLADTKLTIKQRDYQTKIIRAGKALLEIINDILDYSKIEAGKLDIITESFNVRETVFAVLERFRPLSAAKSLSLCSEISADVPCQLVGGSHRLSQMLSNLIHNAIKFTDRGGVSLAVEVIGSSPKGIELEFRVSDTGTGIPEEEQGNLFKAFSQVDSSPTRRFGGSGLGLAICKQLCEAMGGTIGVESTPEKGSDFIVRLPFAIRGDSTEGSLELPGTGKFIDGMIPCFHRARILVVDDNSINRQIAEEMLIKADAEVVLADNGERAVASVMKNRFDTILMDIQMPGMDGLTATRMIRSLDVMGAGSVPIIAMTANAMSGDREKSLDAGMNDHLAKPIEPDALYATLARWLPQGNFTLKDDFQVETAEIDVLCIPGVDVTSGLRRASGNLELYCKLLRKCAGNHADAVNSIQQYLADGRMDEARRLAHNIKGVAGNLGAVSLHHAAAELEGAIEANAPEQTLTLRHFVEKLASFVKEVRKAFFGDKMTAMTFADGLPAGDPDDLKELLLLLEDPMRMHRPNECRSTTARFFAYCWSQEQTDKLLELSELLDNYKFEEADEVRQKLLGMLTV